MVPDNLYHYSEEPDILRFVPRPVSSDPTGPALVWAIDETHAVNYWLPRECPRVIYRQSPKVSEEDLGRFFGSSSADTVIVVESTWLDTIRSTRLYEYRLDSHGFELRDETAGYYISRHPVEPLSVQPTGDLLSRVLSRPDVELRFVPELHTIRNAILSSSVDRFSIIRFRNAMPKQV
ncbi:hypothetical protein E5161_12455 [Cohnella pontilimi]|uniref:Uncharacterized protein n=1 Tax=Cohnella pontilimi TaxID=2564100 RepID=A0A4U0FBC3_9BACL|nr:DUF6886 family protein [Cohnella pontilimi]TJY41997.1 hypothetical protein E5161_12455 [Cohnella pontilimi]